MLDYLPHLTDLALAQHIAELDALAAEEQIGVAAYPGARDLLAALPPDRWRVVTSDSEQMMRSRLTVEIHRKLAERGEE